MRRVLTAVSAALLAAGCGASGRASTRATPSPKPASTATAASGASTPAIAGPRLISFHRVFGTDPLAMTLTVATSGASVATLGYGGRNGLKAHRFELTSSELAHLRRLITHARLRNTDASDFHYYIYWVTTARGSYRMRDGLIPRAARPLIADLNAITDQRTGW